MDILLWALFAGWSVAVATGWLLGPMKAATLPGGSLGAGLCTGLTAHWTIVESLLPALVGLVGWLIYCVMVARWQQGRY